MKVTERVLVDLCRRVNNDQLKSWDSGLKVERRGDEYILISLIRKPREGKPRYLDIYSGSPREVKAFIDGYVHAAEFANDGSSGREKV